MSEVDPVVHEACAEVAVRLRKALGIDFIPCETELCFHTDNGQPVYKVFGTRGTKKPVQDGGLFKNLFEQAEPDPIEDWLYVWSWQIN